MSASGQLAAFLQARRAQLTPGEVGLPTFGDRRRVPGLRREELALLAGVSTSYYTRLEQGQSPNASPEVIDALARALYADWPAKARAVVGNLRRMAGQHPDDPALNALIGELSTRSHEFATLWADHRVQSCSATRYEMRHPGVGTIVANQQTLTGPHGLLGPRTPAHLATRMHGAWVRFARTGNPGWLRNEDAYRTTMCSGDAWRVVEQVA